MNGASSDGSFWDANELDLQDQLNRKIWNESRKRQAKIIKDGVQEIDAQQAMAAESESPLPWVPDVVGKDWKSKDAVMVVGSAYAGFISECSRRSGTLPLEDYCASARCQSPDMFQRKFVELVMQPDLTYYRRIQTLLQGIYAPSRVVLFDLCRASFVKRSGEFEHTSGDGVVKLAPQRFEQYVLANSDWTWERLQGPSRCIVALGTIAEHGILRLFADKNMVVCTGWKSRSPKSPGMWVNEYADSQRILSYWHRNQTWWLVVDPRVNDRCWKILPVYHPSTCQRHDLDYRGARETLGNMKQAPCP